MSHATKKPPHDQMSCSSLLRHEYIQFDMSEQCKKIFTEIPIHLNLIYIFTTKVLNSSWGGTESFDKYPLNKMLYIDIDNCGRRRTDDNPWQ